MGNKYDPRYNSSGYPDPTAYKAMQNVAAEERNKSKALFLIKIVKFIVRESGFEFVHPVEIRDCRTGRIFK